MRNICVFCGSSVGKNSLYKNAARETGKLLVKRGHALVYGGGSIGLMGTIADAVMEAGGQTIGVIPDFLDKLEVGHSGLSELILVESMHERKQKMADLADGFIAMPGGMGTLEEICEIMTWAQLGLHQKPMGFLNINGYYDQLIAYMDHMVEEGFLKPVYRSMVIVANTPAALLDKMTAYQAPDLPHLIERSET